MTILDFHRQFQLESPSDKLVALTGALTHRIHGAFRLILLSEACAWDVWNDPDCEGGQQTLAEA